MNHSCPIGLCPISRNRQYAPGAVTNSAEVCRDEFLRESVMVVLAAARDTRRVKIVSEAL